MKTPRLLAQIDGNMDRRSFYPAKTSEIVPRNGRSMKLTNLRYLTATQSRATVAESATIHQSWATFSLILRITLWGFAPSSPSLIASKKIAGEQTAWLQTGLLSARLLYWLQGSFLFLERLLSMRPKTKNKHETQQASAPSQTVDAPFQAVAI